MIKFPFGSSSKNALGIDIGTFSIKMVELAKKGERLTLENYGEVTTQQIREKPFRSGLSTDKSSFSLSNKEIAEGIKAILFDAKIKAKTATFSIPDFSTFFTTFDLPPMTKEELPKAINFEARQHIPLPLSEVVLDWQVITENGNNGDSQKANNKIILVAVPKEVITQYQEIGRVCGLNVASLEAEVFGLIRSLIKNNDKPVVLLDIGAQSTTINIVENKILKASHSFDIAGNNLTDDISKNLDLNFWEAEDLKKKQMIYQGANTSAEPAAKIMISKMDSIIIEIEKISQAFLQKEGKVPDTVILSGSTALTSGLKEYFAVKLNKDIIIGDPFVGLFYPQILTPALKEIGPSYAIAVGMALRGIEN